ncbi:MAG: hypothetical protein P8K78_04065 [Pirellulales bacterium]|nr:hypothetical protein [Pirellulales bacterium]
MTAAQLPFFSGTLLLMALGPLGACAEEDLFGKATRTLQIPSRSAGGNAWSIHTVSAKKENLRGSVTRMLIPQEVEGKLIEREVLIHAPRSIDASASYPIVFALHGNGGQNRGFLRQLRPFVDRGDFVGIYPQGHRRSWNLGEEASTADDVAFINAIMEKLAEIRQLDTETAFAIGFSNGAGMAHRLAIETDHFLAIAAIVSHMTVEILPEEETATVSVLQISGDRDQIIPYQGGDSPTGHLFLPAEVSSRIWARHNGMKGRPEVSDTPDGNEKIVYGDGPGDPVVIHYRMRDFGHGGFERKEGGINRLAWNFFRDRIRDTEE